MPIRLDTYRNCTFNCEYCFANNRVIGAKIEDTVNIKWLKNKFQKIYDDKNINPKDFLENLLAERITLHGGGQSDCFQPREEYLKYTERVVEICNEYEQHILFSTKTADTYNVPLTPELHTFQLSISNMVGYLEDNVPPIQERIRFFDQLKNEGYKVGIRIQPFIPE
ncbi:hypothetical protein, partial [Faecalibacillus faecis]|uniref:hypothetical protein n=1 Tax=Faecalibacillus faecis TaxID=1982628 RepID=UPI003867736B